MNMNTCRHQTHTIYSVSVEDPIMCADDGEVQLREGSVWFYRVIYESNLGVAKEWAHLITIDDPTIANIKIDLFVPPSLCDLLARIKERLHGHYSSSNVRVGTFPESRTGVDFAQEGFVCGNTTLGAGVGRET